MQGNQHQRQDTNGAIQQIFQLVNNNVWRSLVNIHEIGRYAPQAVWVATNRVAALSHPFCIWIVDRDMNRMERSISVISQESERMLLLLIVVGDIGWWCWWRRGGVGY